MKKINKFWQNLNYWKRGSLIGLLIGLSYVPFGLGLGSSDTDFFVFRILFMIFDFIFELYAKVFCWIFSLNGEECAFTSLYYSLLVIPFFCIIFGGILGYLIKKNDKI